MLVKIKIPSIYNNSDLPDRMAYCTPDMAVGLDSLQKLVKEIGGFLRLSDLFRSRDMQLRAHQDWLTGKKKAYSPPPGYSMHEMGRAMDIDLESLNMPLQAFWSLCKPLGFVPIVSLPDSKLSESWHFEFRGSHQIVHDHIVKISTHALAAKQMAISAGLDSDIEFDKSLVQDVKVGKIQSALIRLGYNPGIIDGVFGAATGKAIEASGNSTQDNDKTLEGLTKSLQDKFPSEFTS